jgi:hypothetical protein
MILRTEKSAALDKFLKAGKTNSRVLGKVERHILSTPRDASRRSDLLHPSAMVSPTWCHRASYFHLLGHEPAPRPITLNQHMIFAEGHRIHEVWQDVFRDMGTLYGMWEIVETGATYWGFASDHNDKYTVKYREVPLDNEELMITGHADGWLVGFGEPLLLEVKSIGIGSMRYYSPGLVKADSDFAAAWKAIDTPFESHISQVQLYLKLLELSDHEVTPQEAVIIYESKVNQEVKEFVVRKDSWGINHILDAAKMIVEAVKTRTPPDCNNGGRMLCQGCKGYKDEQK